jgi:cytochrome P450
MTERPGRIFYDGDAYTDLPSWLTTAGELRRTDPIHRVDYSEPYGPFWAVTRHQHVAEVERRHDKFLNTQRSVLFPIANYEAQEAQGLVLQSLVHMDGSRHRGHRALTNEWFKPANLRKTIGSRVDELARRFVDRMLEYDGECDFSRDIGLYYPLHVIMSLFGVPESDEPLMLELTQQMFGNEDVDFAGEDRVEAVLEAILRFKAYFDELTAARRAAPADDIASVIANGRIDGRPMGEMERLSYYIIIATAGHDTTSSSLTGGLGALLHNPDQLAALQRDPSLIDNAVDEIIRWVTPVRHFMREAIEDCELGAIQLAAGDRLLLSYLSANRDESVFADPERFDIQRANADQHLAFGLGVHFCLGAHLARMELRAFFKELIPRLESIEEAGPEVHTTSSFVGGIKQLPIRYRLHAASSAA